MTEKWDMFQSLGVQCISSPSTQKEDDVLTRMLQKLEVSNRRRELNYNSIGIFMQEAVAFEKDSTISSQQLYEAYKAWCEHEGVIEETMRTFCYWLKHGSYRVKATVLYQNGKQCRGFRGIRIKENDTCDT
jgi:phage/plasmid-associated DNA primase